MERRQGISEAGKATLFEQLVNSSYDAIISKTLEGIITSWNPAAEKIFGYTAGEMIGNHISKIIPRYRYREEVIIQQAIVRGEFIRHYETERMDKYGRVVYVSITVSPIRDENGRITGASKILRDIAEQKKVQDKLAESERIYRTIASSIPGCIITIIGLDRKYILVEGDGLANLGYTKKGLEGVEEGGAIKPEIYRMILPYRERAFQGEYVSGEFNLEHGIYLIRFLPIKNDKGEIYAVMTISLDITEVRKTAMEVQLLNESLEKKVLERTEQLGSLNRELEAFSYSVSHDLRAPLRIINGYADILCSDHKNKLDAEGHRLLGVIMNNTRQMGKLIDALLNMARLGRKELTLQHADMNGMVRGIVNEQLTLYTKPVELVIGELLPAECDSMLMRHVWNNLISNAIKYSGLKETPVVEIGSYAGDGEHIYYVKDNGVGFDMAYSHKLFGVFQRLHKQTEFEGTGVGLALLQRIIAKHKGRVWAEAEEGNGATFYFSLPTINDRLQ